MTVWSVITTTAHYYTNTVVLETLTHTHTAFPTTACFKEIPGPQQGLPHQVVPQQAVPQQAVPQQAIPEEMVKETDHDEERTFD